MKRASVEESQERWSYLEKRAKKTSSRRSAAATTSCDAFDCSDLIVPSNKDLVDGVLEDYAQEWKELDERKVLVQDQRQVRKAKADNKNNDEGEKQAQQHRLPSWGWHANRLRLPEKFDYASRGSSPPVSNVDGDMAVSLENPLQHVSYDAELWSLFQSVPTAQQVEQQAMEGATCHRMLKLTREMTDTLKGNARSDGHALSRMRLRDRHGLPTAKTDARLPFVSTVRIECWRRQLKRGSSPEAHRMEMEFLGSQTLLDVHEAIVELSQDDLWAGYNEEGRTEKSSGLFFVEDTFYTTGPVDYVTPIMKWLNEDPPDVAKEQVSLSRRYFLGIAPQDLITTTSMDSARLDRLKLRLGVRYHHVFNGDIECSVFVTDIRCTHGRAQKYPLVHDILTPTYPLVECEACRRLVAYFVVPPGNAMTHGGATALCRSCCKQLFHDGDPGSVPKITPYNVYREQTDLSVGHEETTTRTPF